MSSLEVSIYIALNGETLIKQWTIKMVQLMLGGASAKKSQEDPLSNDTVKRCILQACL